MTPAEVSVLDVEYAQRVILAALDLLDAVEALCAASPTDEWATLDEKAAAMRAVIDEHNR